MEKNTVWWNGVWWLAGAGLVLRVAFALASGTIYHPDELFQYLEQAHRLVFGYGYIPWEYRFGTRSWLLPLFIALPLWVCKVAHLGEPAVYIPVVKILFCTLSTSLVFSVYAVSRNLVSEQAGRIAAVIAAFWYELLFFSFRPFTETVSTYCLMAALACVTGRPARARAGFGGLWLGLGCALRLQYLGLLPLILLPVMVWWPRRRAVQVLLIVTAIILAAGFLDYISWGTWFVSYYNSYLFNEIYGVSSLFGTSGPFMLLQWLVVASTGIFVIMFLCSLLWLRRLWLPLAVITLTIALHSLIGHKEYRHVFVVIPCLIILTACIAVLFTEGRRAALPVRGGLVAILLIISCAGTMGWLPGEESIYPSRPLYARDPVLTAYMWIARQPDVEAISNTARPWWVTGGYYYFHHAVPIYTPLNPAGSDVCISYSLIPGEAACPAGFIKATRIEDVGVCRNRSRCPAVSREMPLHTTVYQPGVDGHYIPSVTPRF